VHHVPHDNVSHGDLDLLPGPDATHPHHGVGVVAQGPELQLLAVVVGGGDEGHQQNGDDDGGAVDPAVAVAKGGGVDNGHAQEVVAW
jgi:hypothetical protein